jgi:hypothetical protein
VAAQFPFLGIFVSNFRYGFFAVYSVHYPCTYNDALLLTGRPDAEALDRPVRRRRRRSLHPLPDLRGPDLLGVRHEGLILTYRFNLWADSGRLPHLRGPGLLGVRHEGLILTYDDGVHYILYPTSEDPASWEYDMKV